MVGSVDVLVQVNVLIKANRHMRTFVPHPLIRPEEKDFNWKNLLFYQCPKCGADLDETEKTSTMKCADQVKCRFEISGSKFNKVRETLR